MNPESNIFSSNQTTANMNGSNNKRRRLVESQKNTMFRPTIGQSVLIQNQLSNFFKPLDTPTQRSSSDESPSPSPVPTPRQPEKSRHDLFLEQLRLREEYKRRQKQAIEQEKQLAKVQYEEKKRVYLEEQKRVELEKKALAQAAQAERNLKLQQARALEAQKALEAQEALKAKQALKAQQVQVQTPVQVQPSDQVHPQVQQHQPTTTTTTAAAAQPIEPAVTTNNNNNNQPQPTQQQKAKTESDDDIIIDEEMTNKNVCIGMVKTDIVVEKSPLILIRDEQYEIVSLESEGKLNTENYSFKVTSRSQPPRFYGWVPFKDTKVLGPLVDHRLIWWDAVIPRGKATNTRTPLCIILYCRPDLLNTIAKYFESQGLFLKTPPFYNPACRYSNPHHHLLEQHYNQHHHHHHHYSQQYRYQQQQQHAGPYNGFNQHQYAQSNGSNERQSQKDIELLLASIPNDVPQILLKKKKNNSKKLKKNKNGSKKLRGKKNPIIILSDEEEDDDENETRERQESIEEDDDQESKEESEESESEESESEDEDFGYVEGLKCHLMDHQIKGVSWMIDRENNKSSNGGILADMGLGKTIQTIALMASTMTSESDDERDEEDKEEGEDHKITLIVTPLALIHQWVDEIITKTEKGKLRVLKHHGPNRTKNYATFKRYDVVVTTYQVVASDMPSTDKKRKSKSTAIDDFIVKDDGYEEYESKPSIPKHYTPLKKNHGPLFQIKWHRIVLDEAQFIKNRTTKASLSCATLTAVKRWCLTGTPIQNNVDELYSLLRFLRIQPLCDYPTFKKQISIPIMNNETHIAMNRLKAVLMAVMLRRTKSILGRTNTTEDTNGEQIESNTTSASASPKNDESLSKRLTLKLPTRQKTDILLHFTKNERALYQLLMAKSKDTIQSMVGNQNRYMNMLCLLLRLRQACDHPQLILKTIDNDKDILDIVSDTNDNNNNNWQNICDLCGSTKKDLGEQNKPYCLDCMEVLESNTIDKERSLFQTSTKIRKVLEILNQTRESNPGEKTIIFSQFTSMLDLIEGPLKRDGFKVCRYDGSMPSQLRERSLSLLKHDSKTTVMLISLKCGSLGLNLTAANRVILVDIWWNPAVEEQAIDRVHRIGQTLPVHVTRLLVENTVELKIVELQEKKAQLSKGALGDGLVKNAKLSVHEIRSLFDL